MSGGEGSRDAGVTPGQDYRGCGGHGAATEVPGGGYSAYGCWGGYEAQRRGLRGSWGGL